MFTTSHPADPNHRDSARVENRGPWITTTVPVSCTVIPSARAGVDHRPSQLGAVGVGERHVGQGGTVEERVSPAAGAIDQLVDDHELARLHVGLQRSDRARGQDPAHPEAPEGPHVGPEVDLVGWELVVGAVAGEEGDPPPVELAHRHLGRRRTVRRIDGHLPQIVEEAVEAGAAEDADLGRREPHRSQSGGAGRVLRLRRRRGATGAAGAARPTGVPRSLGIGLG